MNLEMPVLFEVQATQQCTTNKSIWLKYTQDAGFALKPDQSLTIKPFLPCLRKKSFCLFPFSNYFPDADQGICREAKRVSSPGSSTPKSLLAS
jgi:hypothetical protein